MHPLAAHVYQPVRFRPVRGAGGGHRNNILRDPNAYKTASTKSGGIFCSQTGIFNDGLLGLTVSFFGLLGLAVSFCGLLGLPVYLGCF